MIMFLDFNGDFLSFKINKYTNRAVIIIFLLGLVLRTPHLKFLFASIYFFTCFLIAQTNHYATTTVKKL